MTFSVGIVIGLALSLPPVSASVCVQSSHDDAASRIKETARTFVERHPKAAVTIGIVQEDRQSVQFFGELKSGDAPDAETLYEIGSITKAFTGTLLADSVLRGKVHLDDQAQPLMPDGVELPVRDGQRIRLIHLATHTSSLPVQPLWLPLHAMATGTADNPYKTFGFKQLAKSLRKMKLSRPIGSKLEYSNLGVGLLGHALAKANESKNYESLLRERILDSLDMGSTYVSLPESLQSRRAVGYGELGIEVSNWDFETLEACGGLKSNAIDMMKFARAAMSNQDSPLTDAFRLARQPFRFEDGDGKRVIGLCWFRKRDEKVDGDVWWHNGGTGGYRSFLGTIPSKGIAVVVLNNTVDSVDRLGADVLHLLSPAEVKASDD